MLLNLLFLLNKIGIDKSVFFTILGRIIQATGGIISVIFISKYLTNVEQGYYYTFGSILAIQIFFELGLTSIITQFVAHEKAFLNWKGETFLFGEIKTLSRLSSLLRFCVLWFGVLSFIILICLLIAGFLFFNFFGDENKSVDWQIPWIVISVSTSINLLVSPLLAFFEGLGKVEEVTKIRLIQQIIQILALFVLMIAGFKLYSAPIAAFISVLIPITVIFFTSKKKLLLNLWNSLDNFSVNYRKEIFPFQWRIALSWISGYFIFQLFNPVVFATEGPKVAGQMGMTLAVLNGILSIPISWVNTKVSVFSSLIAKKQYKKLDQVFNETIFYSSSICFLCLCIFMLGLFGLNWFNIKLSERFLPISLAFLLSISTFVNQIISALATYLRCHKEEPFLLNSIVGGILVGSSTFFFGHRFGIYGIIIGYSFLTIVVGLTWALYTFKSKKVEWHGI